MEVFLIKDQQKINNNNNNMATKDIDQIIKKRKTEKYIAKEQISTQNDDEYKNVVKELLELASHAPVHYTKNVDIKNNSELNSFLPYRIYVLDSNKCRETSNFINENEINAGKITNMLYAADTLFVVTWIPEPHPENKDGSNNEVFFEGSVKNMEHIAAASSAIQNILLGATSRDIPNYWSSGGKIRDNEIRNYLKIPTDEIIIGTVFLFPKEINTQIVQIKEGALHNQDKSLNTWSKYI